jgi:hypothetical protein
MPIVKRRVDHRAEIDWRGPRPKRAEPFIVIVVLCEYRGWAQGRSESQRSSTLEESPARQSSQSARSAHQILPAM